jgi:hypothetical protein
VGRIFRFIKKREPAEVGRGGLPEYSIWAILSSATADWRAGMETCDGKRKNVNKNLKKRKLGEGNPPSR